MISVGKAVIISIWDKPLGIPSRGVSPVIILIRKRFLLGSGLFLCFFCCLAAVLWQGHAPSAAPVFAAGGSGAVTVVLDPGHGGEDGGAVSAGGVRESGLNLEITLRLRDLLTFAGQKTVLTRDSDEMVCDEGLSTLRQRKASDIRSRVNLVNSTSSAVLLSIHQNSLPSSPVTHGAQVFWNRQDGAQALAETVQADLNGCVNTHRAKQAKAIAPTIYLMGHITAPGVLVECGFLTNAKETQALQTPAHQRKLAAAIAAGYLRWAAGEEGI